MSTSQASAVGLRSSVVFFLRNAWSTTKHRQLDSDVVHRTEGVDFPTHFATDKGSVTSIELAVGLQCRRDRPRLLDSEALSYF